MTTSHLSYRSRSSLATCPVAKKLLRLMDEKHSNLCVGTDLSCSQKIIDLANTLGPEIVVFKTHVDMVADFSQDFVQSLTLAADRHKFLLFEDRKFADIGNTTKMQYTKGLHHIVEWADIVNAHPLPGPGVIEALKEGAEDRERGIVLVAQMSSEKNLITDAYSQAAVQMAKYYKECVMGYICQERLDDSPGVIHMVPGVSLSAEGDDQGQRYRTPEKAIEEGGDLIIVGRGICTAKDPLTEAKRYRKAAWDTYEKMKRKDVSACF